MRQSRYNVPHIQGLIYSQNPLARLKSLHQWPRSQIIPLSNPPPLNHQLDMHRVADPYFAAMATAPGGGGWQSKRHPWECSKKEWGKGRAFSCTKVECIIPAWGCVNPFNTENPVQSKALTKHKGLSRVPFLPSPQNTPAQPWTNEKSRKEAFADWNFSLNGLSPSFPNIHRGCVEVALYICLSLMNNGMTNFARLENFLYWYFLFIYK